MLSKRMAVLVAAAVMVLSMLAASAPVFAQELGTGACDPQPGNTEATRSPITQPPHTKPGGFIRSNEANEHDEGVATGRGNLAEEQCA